MLFVLIEAVGCFHLIGYAASVDDKFDVGIVGKIIGSAYSSTSQGDISYTVLEGVAVPPVA